MSLRSKELVYGRYVIRTLVVGAKVKARAFLGLCAVADAKGGAHDEAVLSKKVALNRRGAEQLAARNNSIPTADEFADAFSRLDGQIGRHHWLMLKALYEASGRTLTATLIAAAAGYDSYSSAN